MNMTLEDMELMAFDPPHLGMPAGPCLCGRWERENEGFVEIFIRVEKERIADVGFLTSIHGEGIVCAALCCQALLDKSLDEARSLDERDILAPLPSSARTESAHQIAVRCAAAARKAADGNGTPTRQPAS